MTAQTWIDVVVGVLAVFGAGAGGAAHYRLGNHNRLPSWAVHSSRRPPRSPAGGLPPQPPAPLP